MNLRDLKYFVTVADTCHFGKAAARCFVSQPTLSGQIKKLEDELGVVLFERTNKSVSLTPIGEELLVRAQQVMSDAEALLELARSYADPLAGSLRLGVLPTLSPYLMPLILSPLRKDYPQMRLVLFEETTDRLLERLARREIDAVLIATPVEDQTLVTRPLFDEPFWLAHPRDSELYYHEGAFTHEELDKLNILLLSDGHCLARQVMDVCHLAERSDLMGDMADLRASSLETLLQLVGAGFGCTLIPALALRGAWISDSGVVAQPLELPDASRQVSMMWRQSYPRQAALEALATVILGRLPNTVTSL